jgi:parallel beta-helix repeat protein
VEILGPGMVQKFKRHGIFVVGTAGISTHVTVKHVTSHHNCFSGLLTNMMSDSVIEGNVSVRNAANSGGAPCGGNCLVNSNDNHIWLNVFGGNGSPCPAALCTPGTATLATNNDFGVGLINTSHGNLIESNTITGNANGVLIQAPASGNTIRQNIIAGNPPSQISRDYGPIGFDVKDESATNGGRNTFERNWCITYFGPGPSPCPNFPAAVPPTISAVTATPDVLWPPNHQMVPVTLTVDVTDDADPAPTCQIATVSSNEAITTSDWLVTGPLTLRLRADRDADGTGRIYTITVTCTNSSQLTATETVTVSVPHDQRQ